MLHAIDGKTERTFTVPCGDRLAKPAGITCSDADDFVAIKAGEGARGADMDTLDPY